MQNIGKSSANYHCMLGIKKKNYQIYWYYISKHAPESLNYCDLDSIVVFYKR